MNLEIRIEVVTRMYKYVCGVDGIYEYILWFRLKEIGMDTMKYNFRKALINEF